MPLPNYMLKIVAMADKSDAAPAWAQNQTSGRRAFAGFLLGTRQLDLDATRGKNNTLDSGQSTLR